MKEKNSFEKKSTKLLQTFCLFLPSIESAKRKINNKFKYPLQIYRSNGGLFKS